MNFKTIVTIDVETTSKDPSKCGIVQLAAKAINPRNLTPIVNGEFNIFMKPISGCEIDPETVDFHAKRLGMTHEAVLAMWETNPEAKVAWPEFKRYLQQYHIKQDRQTIHTAPIAAGANIIKFDLPILDRYNDLFGKENPMFSERDNIDLLHWFFMWFENNGDLTSYSMDTIRDYLGIPKEGGHDALKDVQDCSEIIIRFMHLCRGTAAKVKFRGSFKR